MSEQELRQALDDAMVTLTELTYWMGHPVSILRRLRRHSRLLLILTEEIGELAMTEHEDVSWEDIAGKALNVAESRCPPQWRVH